MSHDCAEVPNVRWSPSNSRRTPGTAAATGTSASASVRQRVGTRVTEATIASTHIGHSSGWTSAEPVLPSTQENLPSGVWKLATLALPNAIAC